MKRIAIIMLFVLTMPVMAQTATPTPTATPRPNPNRDCGNGLPCGVIPWRLPQFGALQSPTPFATELVVTTPTLTPTATMPFSPSVTPSGDAEFGYTATPLIDNSGFDSPISTLSGLVDSPPVVIDGYDGTGGATELTGGAVTIFGYMRGIINGLSLGVLTPLFTAFVFLIIFTLGIEVIRYTLPLASVLFGFLRKIVQLILDFIPL